MPKSQISKNGEVLRTFSDWLDENVESAKRKFKKTKLSRATKITADQDESKWEAVKYYFKQLHNTNKMAVNTLFEYLSKLANVGLIDNKLLRAAEKKYTELKHNDVKFFEWLKKHPATSSYLSYYFIIALISLMTWGGIKMSNRGPKDDNDGQKKEIVVEPDGEEIIQEEEDNKRNKKNTKTNKVYDLTDKNFAENFIDENWEDIVIGLLELETYRNKPVFQKAGKDKNGKQLYEKRATYGPGITWVYTKDKNGDIVQNPCAGDYKKMAEGFSKKQVWGQVRLHLLYKTEVMAKIKNAFISRGITQVSSEQIMGLLFAGYQTPAYVDNIVSGIVKAGNNKQKQIDAFQYYKGKNSWKEGTLRRRWWCAMYYLGKIDSNDLLNLNRDVFSKVSINLILKKGHFQQDNAIIVYALGLRNNNSTVREFIEKDKLFSLNDYNSVQTKSKDRPNIATIKQNNPAMSEMIIGLKAFNSGNYAEAIKHYSKAIEIDKDNMEAYSSLSFAYKKLGDEYLRNGDIANAENCYKQSIQEVKNGNSRMNANRDLLLDREIKAYLYYNAGQTRDGLASICLNKNDLTGAIREYDLAAKNYKTAIDNAIEVDMDESLITIYTNARNQSLSNKADVSNKQKAQNAAKNKKKATIKSATSKVKTKGSKKQKFANATIRLKKGKTFNAKYLFERTRSERIA